MTKANNNELWFSHLFRVVGYALLVLSLFDIIAIFIPALFTNPAWEFQTVNSLVERVPVPLIGAVLVFSGEKSLRVFKFLSWACLGAGVLFILLVPLGLSASFRLNQQLAAQVNPQVTRLQQLEAVLNKATTPAEIQSVLRRLNPQAAPVPTQNAEQSKAQLLGQIADGRSRLQAQANTSRSNARNQLVKNTVKSVLGALVSATIFFMIWRQTNRALKANRQRA